MTGTKSSTKSDAKVSQVCPIGHDKIEILDTVEVFNLVGHEASVPQKVYYCLECEQRWVSDEVEQFNEQQLENARAVTSVASASQCLNYIQAVLNIPLVRLETAFGLPRRITSKWKAAERKDGVNSAAVALLNLVKLYPFLVEVAESSYSPVMAERSVLQFSANICMKTANFIVSSNADLTSAFLSVGGGAVRIDDGTPVPSSATG